MDSEKLSYAVQLIKSGDKLAAIPVLREVILANPKDENAWLWLYSCVDNVEQKKQCLQKALAINPDNQSAQRALAKLTGAPLPPSQPKVISQPIGKNKSQPKHKPNTWFFAIGAAIAFLCLCMGTSFVFAQSGQFSSIAADLSLFASATLTPPPYPNCYGNIYSQPNTHKYSNVYTFPDSYANANAFGNLLSSWICILGSFGKLSVKRENIDGRNKHKQRYSFCI